MRNQRTKILCYNSKDIHLPSSMYLDPLCVQINNLLHTGYCNILCKYVNMAMFYYAFFHTEDYILFFLLNKFIFIQNNIISWSSHCAKYCCPGNWLNQQSCVADKLEHEEKYDGRIEELKIILSAPPRRHLLPASPEDSYGNHEFKQILKARFAEWREAFQVSPCTKSFNQNSDLVRHIRVHAKEKPFACSLCGKAFSSSSSLCFHTRVHTGKKSFRCTLCEKSFRDSKDP